MLLMIDNYDSFTYNLVQYLGELGEDVRVYRNDKITLQQIEDLRPDRIVISPGPCTPKEAGVSVETIRQFAGRMPILGVCLGHQSLGVAFGGEVIRAQRLMHGKTSMISHDGKTIFHGLPNPFEATRYHSLLVNPKNLPDCLEISARPAEVCHRQRTHCPNSPAVSLSGTAVSVTDPSGGMIPSPLVR